MSAVHAKTWHRGFVSPAQGWYSRATILRTMAGRKKTRLAGKERKKALISYTYHVSERGGGGDRKNNKNPAPLIYLSGVMTPARAVIGPVGWDYATKGTTTNSSAAASCLVAPVKSGRTTAQLRTAVTFLFALCNQQANVTGLPNWTYGGEGATNTLHNALEVQKSADIAEAMLTTPNILLALPMALRKGCGTFTQRGPTQQKTKIQFECVRYTTGVYPVSTPTRNPLLSPHFFPPTPLKFLTRLFNFISYYYHLALSNGVFV